MPELQPTAVRPLRQWVGVPAALLLAVLFGTSCSTAGSKPVPLGESGTPSATAQAGPSYATDEPVQALLGWFDALFAAERSLDPNHPGLRKYGQGPALAGARQSIAKFKAQGVRLDKPGTVSQPRITGSGKVQGKEVQEVTVCLVAPPDDFVDVKTGQPRAPKERAAGNKMVFTRFVGVMVLMPDGWHIDGNEIEDVVSCAAIG